MTVFKKDLLCSVHYVCLVLVVIHTDGSGLESSTEDQDEVRRCVEYGLVNRRILVRIVKKSSPTPLSNREIYS